MLRLIIAKAGVTYAGKVGGGTIANIGEVHLLLEGAMAVFGDDGTLITSVTDVAVVKNFATFKVATGAASGIPNVSIPVDRDAFLQRLTLAAAAVKQRTYVGKGTSTGSFNAQPIAANDEGGVKIIDMTSGTRTPLSTNFISVTARATDTIATLADRVITMINADANCLVTATAIQTTGVTTGIRLDAKADNTVFDVALDGFFKYADKSEGGVNGSLARKTGRGTFAQILADEKISNTSLGMDNTAGQFQYWWKRPSEAASGITYDQFELRWKTESVIANAPAGMNVGTPSLSLALPAGDATTTEVKAIMTLVLKERSTEASPAGKKASA